MRAVERRLRFQKIENTIPVVMKEDQNDAHSPDAVDSMDTHVKMQRQRKNFIVASKATGDKQKKVQINKMGVGLTPPSNFKASRAKVVSQTSPCHTPGGRDMKLCNKKVGYSMVKAKIDTWRKT
jgi:hypothetical protein